MARVRQLVALHGPGDVKVTNNGSLNDWILSRVDSLEPGTELRCDGLKIAVRKIRRRRVLEAQVVPE